MASYVVVYTGNDGKRDWLRVGSGLYSTAIEAYEAAKRGANRIAKSTGQPCKAATRLLDVVGPVALVRADA